MVSDRDVAHDAGLLPGDVVLCAWGGGVNSTALVIEWLRRGYPCNRILFADTGGEKPETYQYLFRFDAYLRKLANAPKDENTWHRPPGFETYERMLPQSRTLAVIRVVKRHSVMYGNGPYGALETNCRTKGMLPSLAYGFKSCSQKYKHQPQEKFANNWTVSVKAWAEGRRVVKLLGIDYGEQRRAKITEDKKYIYKYPLIDWRWDRDACIAAIAQVGLPVPPKSACFFCPASKKSEVAWLAKEHPVLFQRAVAMEQGAQLTTVKGLGRGYAWGEYVKGLAPDARDTVEQECVCFDGEPDD